MKTYDAMFIFASSLKEKALDQALERVQAEVEKLNGRLLATRTIGKRSFARPMKKKESGVYVRLRLSMEPGSISPLLARLKLKEDIFRVQILTDQTPKPEPTPEPKREEPEPEAAPQAEATPEPAASEATDKEASTDGGS